MPRIGPIRRAASAEHTRWRILTAALTAALPFVAYCVLALVQSQPAAQVAAGVALAAVAVSLLGFMGSDADVAGGYLAAAVIVAVTAQLGTETLAQAALHAGVAELITTLGSLASFAGAAVLAALGAFQLLATWHYTEARAVDVTSGRKRDRRRSLWSLSDTWHSRH